WIGIERIDEQSTRRRVRAVAREIGGEQAVHGAERDCVGSLAGGRFSKIAHGARITNAAVTSTAQAIDLRRNAPHALAATDLLQGEAALRRHGERDLPIGEAQAMVPRLIDGG